MNDQWRRFLEERGARIEAGRILDFGNPEQERQITVRGDTFADLSCLAHLAVGGPDAATFLQGQLTNDVRRLTTASHQISGYCDPKGRLLAIFRIFMTGETQYRLVLPDDIVETTRQRLRRYVLMSQVEIDDESTSLVGLGLHGPRATELCARLCDPVPAAVGDTAHTEGLHVLRIEDAHAPRYLFFGHPRTMTRAWEELDVHAAPVGHPAWGYLDIVAGLPSIHEATIEAFVPQHVDLDRLGGVSFDKGCYTGQEIVARLHYRGQSKRRLYRLRGKAQSIDCGPGTPVLDGASETDQVIGTIVDCQPAPDGRFVALASLLSDAAVPGRPHIAGHAGGLEVEAVSSG